MKKAKYSGGDWKEVGGFIVANNKDIADPRLMKPTEENMIEMDANAKLICAAPRLLETLQTILDRLGTNPMQDDELAKICRREIKAAI